MPWCFRGWSPNGRLCPELGALRKLGGKIPCCKIWGKDLGNSEEELNNITVILFML